MKRRYRIAERGGLYYPQVGERIWFFTSWYKILKMPDTFILQNDNNWENGKTRAEAKAIIAAYELWCVGNETASVTYKYL